MGISFFTGKVRSVGGSILKSDSVAGTVPVILVSLSWGVSWKSNLFVMCRLARKLNFQIGVDGRRLRVAFRQSVTKGNSAPLATSSMCKSRLLSPDESTKLRQQMLRFLPGRYA